MGCFYSKPSSVSGQHTQKIVLRKPKWTANEPMSESELQKMREEFWDCAPHYGGDKVIWDALKAAAEADVATATLIVESAGIIVTANDMSVCYDERGRKYELPRYVLSNPTNLQKDTKEPRRQEPQQSRQFSLVAA